MKVVDLMKKAARHLVADTQGMSFSSPVEVVYQPLDYAWEPHRLYLEKFATTPKRVVFLGMNPGPFGMTQTGIPFGEISAVRDWMGLEAPVKRPAVEHPKRPVQGFACRRSEVSGKRLWGYFQDRFGAPEAFFAENFVANYCPLVFMGATGANVTPDKLASEERVRLDEACDRHLASVLAILKPEWVVGVGGFAFKKLQKMGLNAALIPHPSPASPAANRGWKEAAEKALVEQGVF